MSSPSKDARPAGEPAYLVFDVETVPDGELLRRVRYSADKLTSEQAVQRARSEALERKIGRAHV